jgi:hypothetical protein
MATIFDEKSQKPCSGDAKFESGYKEIQNISESLSEAEELLVEAAWKEAEKMKKEAKKPKETVGKKMIKEIVGNKILMLSEGIPEEAPKRLMDESKAIIGNKHTQKNHFSDCGAVKMMNAENIVSPDTSYEDCSWCQAKMKKITLDSYFEDIENLPDGPSFIPEERNIPKEIKEASLGIIKCDCGNHARYFNTSSQKFYCIGCKTKICKYCLIENCQECFLRIKEGDD